MEKPLVSVICLCYNQERFVEEAIRSVLNQTYSNFELIVVDDASADGSIGVIQKLKSENPVIHVLLLPQNKGNCKAFNVGLKSARGEFIIDLAADDILLPERIAKGVDALQTAGSAYGVNFSDAQWINEGGVLLSNHSERFPHQTIPQGNIYKDLVSRFFICSPTMMYTRQVIEHLGGYDENLSYEDFDFWIRSSRKFLYCYTPEILVKKRVVKKSLSEKQFAFFSPHLHSTFKVCEKIMTLNRNTEEKRALRKRILYELRVSLRLLSFPVAWKYLTLWFKNESLKYD